MKMKILKNRFPKKHYKNGRFNNLNKKNIIIILIIFLIMVIVSKIKFLLFFVQLFNDNFIVSSIGSTLGIIGLINLFIQFSLTKINDSKNFEKFINEKKESDLLNEKIEKEASL
ncbi:MAG: hypothetical protein C0412_02415 [Flavobacterium sp.]|nr:hypothetical protein [Flavobacterium sp.]